ncbi:Protein YIPF5 [Echinococcus granulosus]|nr:Protein YIPF5 [Echinococcus granulosus]
MDDAFSYALTLIWKTLNVLNPMRECPQEVLDDTDLAGPLVFCLIFGGTLLLAGKVHFNYIYGIGLLGCLSMYTLLSLMAPQGVAPTCVVSVLGYCMLPMCVLSTVGIVFSLKSPLGVVLTAFIVFWSAMSSSKLFVRALSLEKQRFLVGYPCALVYAVFALLTIPVLFAIRIRVAIWGGVGGFEDSFTLDNFAMFVVPIAAVAQSMV